jgi:hypothetical protein
MTSVTTDTKLKKKKSIPKFTKVITHNITIHVYHACIQNYCRQSNMSVVFTPESVLAIFSFSGMSGWLQLNQLTVINLKTTFTAKLVTHQLPIFEIFILSPILFHARSSNILASPQFFSSWNHNSVLQKRICNMYCFSLSTKKLILSCCAKLNHSKFFLAPFIAIKHRRVSHTKQV